jgi:hypothetical protein
VERSWLETIQSLGLDVQLGVVLLLFALDGLAKGFRRLVARRAVQPRRTPRRPAHASQPAVVQADAWPPESLPAGGGPAS